MTFKTRGDLLVSRGVLKVSIRLMPLHFAGWGGIDGAMHKFIATKGGGMIAGSGPLAALSARAYPVRGAAVHRGT
jgi:hypothetical protein